MSPSKRKKKIAIFSAIGLVVIIIGAFVAMKARANGNQAPKLPVKVGKAEVADIQVKVTEVGNVQPEVKVDVKSAVSGKVISIFHRDGDLVKRGDVLARVEPDLNQAQSLADTKNALTAAQIRYEQARKNYEQDHNLFLQGLLAPRRAPGVRTRPGEVQHRREERHPYQSVTREVPGLERHRSDGRHRSDQERRDRRIDHFRCVVIQRRHSSVQHRRRDEDDRQSGRERSRHRKDSRRHAGEGHAGCLSENLIRGPYRSHRPRRAHRCGPA